MEVLLEFSLLMIFPCVIVSSKNVCFALGLECTCHVFHELGCHGHYPNQRLISRCYDCDVMDVLLFLQVALNIEPVRSGN